MILSQITRSDVRFELLLCTSDAENLSIVAVVAVGPGITVVAVGPAITVVAVVGISISLWLSISGPLAVVSIRVSSMVSVSGISIGSIGVRVGTIEEGRVSPASASAFGSASADLLP